MSDREVDLIYFDGCPNAERARTNLGGLLPEGSWKEWNLSSTDTPERFRRYGSPTVLVDGRDVTGQSGTSEAMACRADGAPSQEVIRRSLANYG
jgi:mercuric ion transport protein